MLRFNSKQYILFLSWLVIKQPIGVISGLMKKHSFQAPFSYVFKFLNDDMREWQSG